MSEAQESSDAESSANTLRSSLSELGGVLAYGTWAVGSRVMVWGTVGFFLGLFAFLGQQQAQWLVLPAESYQALIWLLMPVYMLMGASFLGTAGGGRGLGRLAIHVTVTRGLSRALLQRILDKTIDLVREKHGASVDRASDFAENIPLQDAEDGLKSAVASLLGSSELEPGSEKHSGVRKRLVKRLNKMLCGHIEKYLLRRFRAERKTSASGEPGGGGISLVKVREASFDKADEAITKLIEGAMLQQSLLMFGAMLLSFAALPGALHGWRLYGG